MAYFMAARIPDLVELPVTAQASSEGASVSGQFVGLAPGIALSMLVGVLAHSVTPHLTLLLPLPTMVIALMIGMALNPIAMRPSTRAGIAFCVRTVLRWAVALLGLRIGLGEIAALGIGTSVVLLVAMLATVISGFLFARWSGNEAGFGALIGVGTAVCGASATLACSTVVPEYKNKQADVAFVVVAANALATVAMLLYPSLCSMIGFDARTTGIILGGTIHDVAQVAGAGYAISDSAGNAAVVAKLFRVFLLLPVVMAVGWYLGRKDSGRGKARVPVPVFGIVFLLLCALNSAMPLVPPLMPIYAPIRVGLIEASSWGLLVAIGALGLGTSVSGILALGWRHVAAAIGTSAVILAVVVGGLLLIGA